MIKYRGRNVITNFNLPEYALIEPLKDSEISQHVKEKKAPKPRSKSQKRTNVTEQQNLATPSAILQSSSIQPPIQPTIQPLPPPPKNPNPTTPPVGIRSCNLSAFEFVEDAPPDDMPENLAPFCFCGRCMRPNPSAFGGFPFFSAGALAAMGMGANLGFGMGPFFPPQPILSQNLENNAPNISLELSGSHGQIRPIPSTAERILPESSIPLNGSGVPISSQNVNILPGGPPRKPIRFSKYRGITRHHGRWQARIKESRRDIHLGYFDTGVEISLKYSWTSDIAPHLNFTFFFCRGGGGQGL